MMRCPDCHTDFTPNDAAIPCRCPGCDLLVIGSYLVVDWVGSSTLGNIYRAVEPGTDKPTVLVAVPKCDLDVEAARQQCAALTGHTRQLVEQQFIQSMHRGEEMGRSYLVLEPAESRPLDELLTRLESFATKNDATRIDVICPHCETVYHLRSDTIGRSIACPNNVCGQTFIVTPPEPEPLDAQIISEEPEPLDAQIAETPASGHDQSAPSASTPGPSDEIPKRPRSVIPWKVVAITIGLIAATCVLAWRYVDMETVFGPDPDAQWADVMNRVEEKKWDRLGRDLDRFESRFLDSPYHEQIPFYHGLARAGHDVYSPTGNASKGLSALEPVLRRHRELPPDPSRTGRLHDALTRLVSRLSKQASEADDPKLLDRARRALQLAETLRIERHKKNTQGGGPFLTLPIDLAETTLRFSQQEREVETHLEAVKRPDLSTDPDFLYSQIAEIRSQWPRVKQQLDAIAKRMKFAPAKPQAALNEIETFYHSSDFPTRIDEVRAKIDRLEAKIDIGLSKAYQIEAERVAYTPHNADTPEAPDTRVSRQGSMLAVVFGEKPGDVTVWNDTSAGKQSPESHDVLWALSRGVLHAFTPDGTLLWARRLGIDSHRLPQRIECSTAATPLSLVVSAEDNSLIALEETTGRPCWRYMVGQDIAAPPTIIRSNTTSGLGLLPTVEGDIHVIEISLGEPLGRFHTGYPLAFVSGAFDPMSGIAFFAADARRLFAIDLAAIDDPMCLPCRSVLRTEHTSGSIRCSPLLIGRNLIVIESTSLHTTRIRAFPLRSSSDLDPTGSPRAEARMNGWPCFDPLIISDRFTLLTDRGELGTFGLNVDNPAEALYPIVPTWNANLDSSFRGLAIRAEETEAWILAGRSVRKMSLDLLGQQFRSQWQREDPIAGVPLHSAQMDRSGKRFFLATTSPGGRCDNFSAVDMKDGKPIWRRQIGVNILGDPMPYEDGTLILDRSGRSITLRPGRAPTSTGRRLPEGANGRQLMKLGHSLDSLYLAVPLDEGSRLAITRIDPEDNQALSPWFEVSLPDRLHGRPCVQDDFLVVPCVDGQVYRLRFRGDGKNDRRQLSFATRSTDPVDLVSLDEGAILFVGNGRQLRRLDLRVDEKVARWEQVGGLFELDDERAILADLPLRIGDWIYVFDTGGTLYRMEAADPASHDAVWQLNATVSRGPVMRADRLLAVVEGKRIACITPDTSADSEGSRWISEPFDGRIRGMPHIAADLVLVADNSRRITAIGLDDGQPRWQIRLQSSAGPSASPVPCAKNKMLVPLSDGTLTVMTMPRPE